MPGYHSLARGNSHASTEMAELPYRSRETIDSTALSKETEPVLDSEIYFPEGGVQGWLVVLGVRSHSIIYSVFQVITLMLGVLFIHRNLRFRSVLGGECLTSKFNHLTERCPIHLKTFQEFYEATLLKNSSSSAM